MKWKFAIGLAAAISLSTTVALASDNARAPQWPHLGFVETPAVQLRLGMTAHDVADIMGTAAKVTTSRAPDASICVLEFSGAISSKVVLKNGSVSRVALDVFHIEAGELPEFGRRAWPGMADSAVRRLLGDPTLLRHHNFFGIETDQWVFSRAGQIDVSLFFRAGRVIARATGRDVPQSLFRIDLPSTPEAEGQGPSQSAQAGMTMKNVGAVYGEQKLRVDYEFNGQSASRVVLKARSNGAYVGLTLVNGVVTEFEDLGRLSDEASFWGR